VVERSEQGTVLTTGGVRYVRDPWNIDDGTLTPMGFQYEPKRHQADTR
jgi:hypothetical protein